MVDNYYLNLINVDNQGVKQMAVDKHGQQVDEILIGVKHLFV